MQLASLISVHHLLLSITVQTWDHFAGSSLRQDCPPSTRIPRTPPTKTRTRVSLSANGTHSADSEKDDTAATTVKSQKPETGVDESKSAYSTFPLNVLIFRKVRRTLLQFRILKTRTQTKVGRRDCLQGMLMISEDNNHNSSVPKKEDENGASIGE